MCAIVLLSISVHMCVCVHICVYQCIFDSTKMRSSKYQSVECMQFAGFVGSALQTTVWRSEQGSSADEEHSATAERPQS